MAEPRREFSRFDGPLALVLSWRYGGYPVLEFWTRKQWAIHQITQQPFYNRR